MGSNRRQRWAGLALLPFLLAGMAGCAANASAPAATPTASASQTGPATSAPAKAAESHPDGDPVKMVCGDEIKQKAQQILGLPGLPATTPSEDNGIYSCTYKTADGVMVLSVKKSASAAAAKAYFAGYTPTLPGAKPIEGMGNLGLPAAQTPGGIVVFVKDDMTLTVDTSWMPATVGPHGVSRGAVAYQLATDVIACWSE